MEKVTLKEGRYSLIRERDGWGESGFMFHSIDIEKSKKANDYIKTGETGDIIVGCPVQCGSHYARSYSKQDWILTTPVEEILKVNKDKTEVKFKTRNSVYIARSN